MKSFIKLFVAVFFILAAVRTSQSVDYTVSGKVRYADNNELVTSGVVKCFNPDGTVEAIGQIEPNGDWILIAHRLRENQNIIGFPNNQPEEDFVPTGYPNVTNPALFTQVDITGNISNLDIYVQRTLGGMRPGGDLRSITGSVFTADKKPVKDAIIYAMVGNDYYAYGVSNAKGEYKIENVPQGDYILVAHKVGSESDSKGITVTEKGMDNVVFNVTPKNILGSPVEFTLTQNYPNPFNPSTVISYSVPKDGPVSLKVYNTVGQQVAELINTVQNAGIYNVEFNAQNLSSGIYYYRLETSGFTDTKKMVLVK